MYSFIARGEKTINIYGHSDGYPSGALEYIEGAPKLAWPLPRFEPGDWAAAFLGANKKGPGNFYIYGSGLPRNVAPWDLAYRYEIRGGDKHLQITCIETNYGDNPCAADEKVLFEGALPKFKTWVAARERAEKKVADRRRAAAAKIGKTA
jgi:hypothetical protein